MASYRFVIPFFLFCSLLFAGIYGSVQQVLRQSANDPQIQLAEDGAHAMQNGQTPAMLLPNTIVDISQSLSPYVMVLDDQQHVLASSAQLHGQVPTIPQGVFISVKTQGEERVTWQPEPGVRQAIVVVHYSGAQAGYVVAGRSLREVEKREDQLLMMLVAGWIVTLGVIYLFTFLFRR